MRAFSATYTRARVRGGEFIMISCTPDDDEVFTRFTRVCSYENKITPVDRSEAAPNKWNGKEFDVYVTSIALYLSGLAQFPLFCYLSGEGDVILNKRPHFPREKIMGAGISSPDSLYGRMSHLRQIRKNLSPSG